MKTLISVNPANNHVIGEVPVSSPEEIERKVKAAHEAKLSWKRLGITKRIELLSPLLDAFRNREEELALLITREIGKPITESKADLDFDFLYLEDFLKNGKAYLEDEYTVKRDGISHRIVYEPRGVAAYIVPWNFPLTNFLWSVLPNLIAGNTVIFKHSEECPLFAKRIEEILRHATSLPEGVFSQVFGGVETGKMLVEQHINLLGFIGSSAVGQELSTVAGRKFIRCVLEMGGSNPALVFDDVDVNAVIPKIYRGRFSNCGQVCDAVKRVIVHRRIHDEFVEKFAHYLRQIKVGDPESPDTEIGSLCGMRHLAKLEEQVDDAIFHGATVVVGGKRPEGFHGAYYLPTLLTNVNSTMRVWDEEVFGPVLSIIPFETEEEAIHIANDTPYGLGAVVHSKDVERAHRVAHELDVGYVDINDGNHWEPCNPFGGHRFSGMGCEHGRHGFRELCQIKLIAEG